MIYNTNKIIESIMICIGLDNYMYVCTDDNIIYSFYINENRGVNFNVNTDNPYDFVKFLEDKLKYKINNPEMFKIMFNKYKYEEILNVSLPCISFINFIEPNHEYLKINKFIMAKNDNTDIVELFHIEILDTRTNKTMLIVDKYMLYGCSTVLDDNDSSIISYKEMYDKMISKFEEYKISLN